MGYGETLGLLSFSCYRPTSTNVDYRLAVGGAARSARVENRPLS
jgi:hypothetical protein